MQLLNFARCEFLLVATSEEPAAELGASAQELAGADAERECPDADEECLLQQLKEETKAEVSICMFVAYVAEQQFVLCGCAFMSDVLLSVQDVGIEMAPIETGEWA